MLQIETIRRHQPAQLVNIADVWRGKGVILADCPAWTPIGRITEASAPLIATSGYLGIRLAATGSRRTHHFPRSVCEFASDGTLIIVAMRHGAHSSFPLLFGSAEYASAGTAGRGGLALHNGSGAVYAFYRNAANSAWNETSPSSWALNTPAVWGMRKQGSNLSLWRDGVQVQLNASATAGPAQPSTNEIGYGVQASTTTTPDTDVYLAVWASKALPDIDMQALGINPWQVFESVRRTYFIPSAAPPGGFQAAWARNSNTVIQAAA